MCCKYETSYENTQVEIRIIDKYTTNRPPFMEVNELLNTLILHFANGNQSRFARILGLSPSTVATWIARKTFDPERIKRSFPQVDGNWLLTGNGEMLLPENNSSVHVNGSHNTTQVNSTGNIDTTESNDNERITLQHTIELLQKDNAALHAILDEKERLIKVLLAQR